MGKLKAVGRFIRSVLCHLTGGTRVYHVKAWDSSLCARVLLNVQSSSRREATEAVILCGYSQPEIIAEVIPFEQKASV